MRVHQTLWRKPAVCALGLVIMWSGAGCGPSPSSGVTPADHDPDSAANDNAGPADPDPSSNDNGDDGTTSPFAEDADPAVAGLAFVENELLVRSFPGADPVDLDVVYEAAGAVVAEQIPQIETTVLRVEPGELTSAASALAGSALIEAVQKSYVYEAQRVPDDPYFTDQKSYLELVGLPQAWDVTTGSADVVIAILDSGVYAQHPDLSSRLTSGRNVVADNTDTADRYGHGTSVAGVAGAAGNNATGIAGVNWTGRLMPVMVTNSSGQSTSRNIAKGLVWASDNGAKVANVSFAPLQSDRTVLRAAEQMQNDGGLVFIAAGNDGKTYDTRSTGQAVFVGAVSAAGVRASFSTAGPFVDLAAPGMGVVSTASDGGISGVNGTSFASPMVAGVAALVWSVAPELKPADVADLLLDTATDAGERGRDVEYGEGIVNAAAAVAGAASAGGRSDTVAPLTSITAPANNASVSGVIQVKAQATDASRIARVVLSLDGTVTATDTAKPFTFAVNADKLPVGAHSLSCTATDEYGNVSGPTSVTVFVARSGGGGGGSGDTTAPAVSINFPANGAVVSSSVGVQATATDNVGLARVEWLVDGAVRRSEAIRGTRAVVSFRWDAASAAKGSHTITVRVTDAAGLRAAASVSVIRT